MNKQDNKVIVRIWNGYKITKNNSNSYSVKPEMEKRAKTYQSLKSAVAEAEKHPTGPYTGPQPQITEICAASMCINDNM